MHITGVLTSYPGNQSSPRHGSTHLSNPGAYTTPHLPLCASHTCYTHPLPTLVRMLSRSVVSNSLQPHGLLPSRLLSPRDFPGKNTGVGCHFLLQGIFLIQELNLFLLHLLHWQADSLPTDLQGKPGQRWVLYCPYTLGLADLSCILFV